MGEEARGSGSGSLVSIDGTNEPSEGIGAWAGKWFTVSIQSARTCASADPGFLKIQSWDPVCCLMQAALFTRNVASEGWRSSALTFYVTSGNARSFLFYFGGAGLPQYTASIRGIINAGRPRSGILTVKCLSVASCDDSSACAICAGTTMSGSLVDECAVPAQIQHSCSVRQPE